MISIERVDIGEAPTDVILVLSIPPDLVPEFKHAMFRAMNTWQDCSPQMRDFYDRLTEREHIMGDNMKRGLNTSEDVKSEFKSFEQETSLGRMAVDKWYSHVPVVDIFPKVTVDPDEVLRGACNIPEEG